MKGISGKKWLEVFGVGARVKRREFLVQVHGIRIKQAQNQADTVRIIYEQNPRFSGSVEILRTNFSKKLLKSGRPSGPLMVAVAEPEQANQLIDSGLIWMHELHDCEPFYGECIVTQCFKCFKYGHIARMCRGTQRYGACGAPGHTTEECTGKEDRTKHRCISCRGNHQSWHSDCPVRKAQVIRSQEAYHNRPTRYQVRTKEPTPPASRNLSSTTRGPLVAGLAAQAQAQAQTQTAQTTPTLLVRSPTVALVTEATQGLVQTQPTTARSQG